MKRLITAIAMLLVASTAAAAVSPEKIIAKGHVSSVTSPLNTRDTADVLLNQMNLCYQNAVQIGTAITIKQQASETKARLSFYWLVADIEGSEVTIYTAWEYQSKQATNDFTRWLSGDFACKDKE